MRRVVSACLLQTMRFDTLNGADPEKDLEIYCKRMDMKKARYVIEGKEKQPDGSLLVKVRRQYNQYQADGYME